MIDSTWKILNEEVRQNTGLNMMENRNIASVITTTAQLSAIPPSDQTLCGNVLLLPLEMAEANIDFSRISVLDPLNTKVPSVHLLCGFNDLLLPLDMAGSNLDFSGKATIASLFNLRPLKSTFKEESLKAPKAARRKGPNVFLLKDGAIYRTDF